MAKTKEKFVDVFFHASEDVDDSMGRELFQELGKQQFDLPEFSEDNLMTEQIIRVSVRPKSKLSVKYEKVEAKITLMPMNTYGRWFNAITAARVHDKIVPH